MEDVQWYDRSELAAAARLYDENPDDTIQSGYAILMLTMGR
jgi:hypothetical protein